MAMRCLGCGHYEGDPTAPFGCASGTDSHAFVSEDPPAVPQRATAVLTCEGCPTQWEGTTTDGRAWYFRYRWGVACLGFGSTMDEAVDDTETRYATAGDPLDGVMSEGLVMSWWDRLAAKRVP